MTHHPWASTCRVGIEQATNEVARFEVYAWVDVYPLIARLRASIIVLGLHHACSAGGRRL